jgi:hypothetical protein
MHPKEFLMSKSFRSVGLGLTIIFTGLLITSVTANAQTTTPDLVRKEIEDLRTQVTTSNLGPEYERYKDLSNEFQQTKADLEQLIKTSASNTEVNKLVDSYNAIILEGLKTNDSVPLDCGIGHPLAPGGDNCSARYHTLSFNSAIGLVIESDVRSKPVYGQIALIKMNQTFTHLGKEKIKGAHSISNPYAAKAVAYLAGASVIGTAKYIAAESITDAVHEKAFEGVVDSGSWSAAPYQAAASSPIK